MSEPYTFDASWKYKRTYVGGGMWAETWSRIESGGTTSEKGKVPSPEAAAIPQSPQRGEVGEEAMEWLREQIRHSQNVFSSCPRNEATYGPPLAYQKEILAALSRPPVVRTEAESKMIDAVMETFAGGFDMDPWLKRLARIVAAERALAVTPRVDLLEIPQRTLYASKVLNPDRFTE